LRIRTFKQQSNCLLPSFMRSTEGRRNTFKSIPILKLHLVRCFAPFSGYGLPAARGKLSLCELRLTVPQPTSKLEHHDSYLFYIVHSVHYDTSQLWCTDTILEPITSSIN
jgi:hypothetical protein